MIRLMTCTANDGGSNWMMTVKDMEEKKERKWVGGGE